MRNDSRSRLLLIYMYLLKTSREKPVTRADIVKMLIQNGIYADRKTISDDLKAIQYWDIRFDRVGHQGRNQTYYWIDKERGKNESLACERKR